MLPAPGAHRWCGELLLDGSGWRLQGNWCTGVLRAICVLQWAWGLVTVTGRCRRVMPISRVRRHRRRVQRCRRRSRALAAAACSKQAATARDPRVAHTAVRLRAAPLGSAAACASPCDTCAIAPSKHKCTRWRATLQVASPQVESLRTQQVAGPPLTPSISTPASYPARRLALPCLMPPLQLAWPVCTWRLRRQGAHLAGASSDRARSLRRPLPLPPPPAMPALERVLLARRGRLRRTRHLRRHVASLLSPCDREAVAMALFMC